MQLHSVYQTQALASLIWQWRKQRQQLQVLQAMHHLWQLDHIKHGDKFDPRMIHWQHHGDIVANHRHWITSGSTRRNDLWK